MKNDVEELQEKKENKKELERTSTISKKSMGKRENNLSPF